MNLRRPPRVHPLRERRATVVNHDPYAPNSPDYAKRTVVREVELLGFADGTVRVDVGGPTPAKPAEPPVAASEPPAVPAEGPAREAREPEPFKPGLGKDRRNP